ncbi:MAG: hypothetical protein RMK65_01630, partial [Anaerolineae bacterium]|nr:hypothetical protein [Anaerolineae bacterium]
ANAEYACPASISNKQGKTSGQKRLFLHSLLQLYRYLSKPSTKTSPTARLHMMALVVEVPSKNHEEI